MENTPKITVIVPVYRAEKYLHDCVGSILSQSVSDFQLILVDDGSPDNCGKLCDDYAAQDRRVISLHQENAGQAAARNLALEKAAGEWLCFVDSDDRIHPDMLKLLLHAAEESGAGISMCQMLESPEFPTDFDRPREGAYRLETMDEENLLRLCEADAYPGWVACAKLIRTELVKAYPFCPGRVYEDNEAVCHWLLPAKTIAILPEKLYFYRTNPESTTKGAFTLKRLDYLWALESIQSFYRSQGYRKLAERFLSRYVTAVENACTGVRRDLNRPELSGKIAFRTWRYLRREKIRLTKRQRLTIWEAAYPKEMARFWYAAGKLKRFLRKGGHGA